MDEKARSAAERQLIPDAKLAGSIRRQLKIDREELTVEKLATLRELNGNESGISNLAGIENCFNLERLALQDNAILEIDAVAMLKNLELLSLNGNPISGIECLGEMPNLRSLYLGKTMVSDLSFINRMDKIEVLSVVFSKVDTLIEVYLWYFFPGKKRRLRQIFLFGNRLSAGSYGFIAALQEAGVEVQFDVRA